MSHLSGRDIRKASKLHARGAYVEVWLYGVRVLATDVGLPPLIDGTVNYSPTGINRRGSITFESQNPGNVFLDLLANDNAEWVLYCDWGYHVKMGHFFLRDFSIDDTGRNTNYRLYVQDISASIAERKTLKAYSFQGDVVAVAKAILETSGLSLTFTGIQSIGLHTSVIVEQEKDPWAFVVGLLEPYGLELRVSKDGEIVVLEMHYEPEFVVPDMESTLLAVQETVSRRSCNHIIVYNDNFRGEAIDHRPFNLSGSIPLFFKADALTSNDQCTLKAQALGTKYFGRQHSKTHTCLQIPHFDLNDSYRIANKIFVVDQASFSLIANRPMYLTGRGESYDY